MSTIADQRTRALAIANSIRLERAGLKGEIHVLSKREGLAMVADIVVDGADRLASMPVMDLLVSVRGLGRLKARTALKRVDRSMPLDPWVKLGELSPGRRERLAGELRRLAAS